MARRRRREATTALVVLVIVLSTFATVARYADALGRDRAADLHLDALPRVTVFTPKNLVIEADGVVDDRCSRTTAHIDVATRGCGCSFFEAKVGKRRKRRFPVGGEAAAVSVNGFSVRGDDKADFRVARGTCRVGARLAPRMRCHLEVTFAPRAKGDRSAVLVVDVEPGEDEGAELSGLGR